MKQPLGRRTTPGKARRGGPPQAVGEVLASLLRRRGLEQEIEDHRILVDWGGLVGDPLGHETRPMKVERGILWIGVNSAPLANSLLYLKPVLLRRIRERFPRSRIQDLRVLHRPERGRSA